MRKNKRIMNIVSLSSALMLLATSIYVSPEVSEAKAVAEITKEALNFQVMPDREIEVKVPVYHELKSNAKTKAYAKFSSAVFESDVTIPSSYDSRNKNAVVPVQNQARTGCCWAFATLAALESSAIMDGIKVNGQVATKDNLNLSERHLAYYAHHNVTDNLGGLAGDDTILATKTYLNSGNWAIEAIYSLATWKGATHEYIAPFEPLTSLTTQQVADKNYIASYNLDDSMAYTNNALLVKDAYAISYENPELIKEEIMKHGAAIMEFHIDQANGRNSKTNACFNNTSKSANHDVCIVGWDDNYSKENFLSTKRPENNGAWLIKNSWGTNNALGGYYWVSYEDTSLVGGNGNGAYILRAQEVGTYDNNYQYDGTTNRSYINVWSSGSLANRFVVPSNANSQKLKAVSIAVNDTNVGYSIQIYKNCNNTDPTSGEPQLATPQTGSVKYLGYYTIPLEQEVTLSPGDSFSVVVTLTDLEEDLKVKYSVDKTTENSSESYIDTIRPGECFCKYSDTSAWKDTYSLNTKYTPRIKAFTSNI